eukprot:TRINITY_DN926_c1_g1_i2.p1 TRINITY_DN926_c1_g1~~TRINITY_DN926_c1_g1_i2.p1  ORF type:complete len:132 (+),score=21.01 TRINITY_DN926_c1_g1_i2:341-736(+)
MSFTVYQAQDSYYINETFQMKWNLQNTGPVPWPVGCTLNFVSGDLLGGPKSMPAPSISPGENVDLELVFTCPPLPGQYAGSWKMSTSGDFAYMFGEDLWVIINVSPRDSIEMEETGPNLGVDIMQEDTFQF